MHEWYYQRSYGDGPPEQAPSALRHVRNADRDGRRLRGPVQALTYDICMFSPCSQGVSSNKNPNRKNIQKQNILLSVCDRAERFTWSPGAEKLPTAPGGACRKAVPGWVKCRAYISQRPQACVCLCVCVLCRHHKIHV